MEVLRPSNLFLYMLEAEPCLVSFHCVVVDTSVIFRLTLGCQFRPDLSKQVYCDKRVAYDPCLLLLPLAMQCNSSTGRNSRHKVLTRCVVFGFGRMSYILVVPKPSGLGTNLCIFLLKIPKSPRFNVSDVLHLHGEYCSLAPMLAHDCFI